MTPERTEAETEARIRARWQAGDLGRRVAGEVERPAPVRLRRLHCRHRARRRSVWELELADAAGGDGRAVLKIHHRPDRRASATEIGLYRDAHPRLARFLPRLYSLDRTGDGEAWIWMEYLPPLTGRAPFRPETFRRILPSVAAFHAATYRANPSVPPQFCPWLEGYRSPAYRREKAAGRQRTLLYLARGMAAEHLAPLVGEYFAPVSRVLAEAPLYLPQLPEEGAALVHGDLHTHNICCRHLGQKPWDVRLIDWESARFAPVWFELAVLVEILIDFRPDWWEVEAEVRREAVACYAAAMEAEGISLPGEPLAAFKAAYYERTLERGLYTQLRRELAGRRGQLLPRYLAKLVSWGRELGVL